MKLKALCFMTMMTSSQIFASNFFISAFDPYKNHKRKNTRELTLQESIMISRTTMFTSTIEEITHNMARIRKISEDNIDYCEVCYADGTTLRYKIYAHPEQERQEYYQNVMATTEQAIYKISPGSKYAEGQISYFINTLQDHRQQINSIFQDGSDIKNALIKQNEDLLAACHNAQEQLKTTSIPKETKKADL